MSARFITFEGGEGTGKSTQCRLLSARLAAAGIDNVVTREPGGTPFAEAVRGLVLSDRLPPRAPLSEALLFLAARADHAARLIVPALERGTWVISDRYSDSTTAYQGMAGEVPTDTLKALDALVVGGARPDLTLVLDLPAAVGLARVESRRQGMLPSGDPYEGRELAYHERLRQAFLDIATDEPDRCFVVDAAGTTADVAEQVWSAVAARLLPGAVT